MLMIVISTTDTVISCVRITTVGNSVDVKLASFLIPTVALAQVRPDAVNSTITNINEVG